MATGQSRDGWSWKTFLNPLNSGLLPQVSTRTANCVSGGSLVGRFRESLATDYNKKSTEKNKAVTSAREALKKLLRKPDFGELERQWKQYENALKMKSDRENTGSAWKIKMLERYIHRQDIEFVPESRLDSTDEEALKIPYEKVMERVDFAMKAICGGNQSVENLQALHIQGVTESDTTKILDAILQPLCVVKELTLRSEQTIKSAVLPASRYDYIIYNNVDEPIGVIEAKRRGGLKDQSVAQLLVELLLLSSEKPNCSYFGILSDAYQFIFAGVSMEKILFFQTNEKELEITTIKSDLDVRNIVDKISWLINFACRSRKDIVKSFDTLKIRDSSVSK